MTELKEFYGGHVTATYKLDQRTTQKLKQVQERPRQKGAISSFFYSAFLPEGYPESVSEDYLDYQKWDSLQALVSSLTGLFATRAILQGVGVGSSEATPAAATLQWLVRDGTGMIGRILFAWMKGSELDSNAKTWRFVADITNDLGMTLELLAPLFPSFFLLLACFGSVMKGVAGGCTKAAISRHQARKNNMAGIQDVSAKDGSQETAVSFLGMILGILVSPFLDGPQTTIWIIFLVLTCVHLFANYMAVSSLVFDTVNTQRGNIVIETFLKTGNILTPKETARREKIFPIIRSKSIHIYVGVSIDRLRQESIGDLLLEFGLEKYLLQYSAHDQKIFIVLDKNSSDIDIFKGHVHAVVMKFVLENDLKICQHQTAQIMRLFELKFDIPNLTTAVHEFVQLEFQQILSAMKNVGWTIESNLISIDQWRAKWKTNE